ncbi:MAG: methyltransferase MtaB domain-containing protein [Anaerolineaceae bacterium]|jgi:methanol--5-hydroxybenzimidazolylcobamide Co-methyltransferase
MTTYHQLAIDNLNDFVYGVAPRPVRLRNGLTIGGGQVYPELNFTLPPMEVNAQTMPEVRAQYTQMISESCARAVELHAPGLLVEFELLPDLTIEPAWGAEITRILRDTLNAAQAKHGLLVGLRVTPNDVREFERPPLTRHGHYVERMFESFAQCAQAGADLLSIESTGGKEVHDDAILHGDLHLSAFALGILGSRDMAFLWQRIAAISAEHGAIPAGDSACGFANTAMVLAENRYIPRVWAAVIRVMSTARSLVAFEHGARGPSKDCAYEGVYLKAITGCPISLEGAEAACAHLSPIGNITKALPDLWSNESVQNLKLLGAMAPTVSLEQLIYATRLMNVAAAQGRQPALTLRDWWAASDAHYDPQAYILRPDIVLRLARQIVSEPSPYLRTRRAALATLECLRNAGAAGDLTFNRNEQRWLDRLSKLADELPGQEDAFIDRMVALVDTGKVRLDQYLIKPALAN